MSALDELRTRLDFAIKHLDEVKKEYEEKLARCRKETGRVYQDRSAAMQALRKLGCHEVSCEAYKQIGRFGSRTGLRWVEGDEKKCNCGFREGLQIHESGTHTRAYS